MLFFKAKTNVSLLAAKARRSFALLLKELIIFEEQGVLAVVSVLPVVGRVVAVDFRPGLKSSFHTVPAVVGLVVGLSSSFPLASTTK
jgi:hypothetical protein